MQEVIKKLSPYLYYVIMTACVLITTSWGLSAYFTSSMTSISKDINAIKLTTTELDANVKMVASNLHKIEVAVSNNTIRIAYLEKQCDKLIK